MKKFCILLFLALLFQSNIHSQTTIEKKIYFEFDKSEISAKSEKTIDSLVKHLNKYHKFSLKIIGHTDPKGTNEYNQILANARAEEVYKQLLNKGINDSVFDFVGAGNTNPENEISHDKMRFVSIYAVFDKKDKKYKPRNFTASGGTIVSANIKDGSSINFEITEFYSSRSMIENEMYAIDENDNILETAGMIKISSAMFDCNDIENEITIKMPLLNGNPFDEEMTLWSGALNIQNLNRWSNLDIKPKLDSTGKFYEVKLPCEAYRMLGATDVFLNLDKSTLSVMRRGRKRAVLVVVPGEYNFIDVALKVKGGRNTNSFSGKINDSTYAFVISKPHYKYDFYGYFDENKNGKYTNGKYNNLIEEKYDGLLYAQLKNTAVSRNERKIWKYTVCETCNYKLNETEYNKKVKKKGFFEWIKGLFSK